MKKIIFDVDGGITIYHDNDENLVRLIAASVFVDQEYKEGYEAIKNRKNPVILDIGAHIGMASIYFSKIKGARIFAFEPCKKNYKYLVKNTKRLKNIKTFNYGISAFNSENREFGLETLYFKQQGKPPLEVIKTRNFQWILDTLKLDDALDEVLLFCTIT